MPKNVNVLFGLALDKHKEISIIGQRTNLRLGLPQAEAAGTPTLSIFPLLWLRPIFPNSAPGRMLGASLDLAQGEALSPTAGPVFLACRSPATPAMRKIDQERKREWNQEHPRKESGESVGYRNAKTALTLPLDCEGRLH